MGLSIPGIPRWCGAPQGALSWLGTGTGQNPPTVGWQVGQWGRSLGLSSLGSRNVSQRGGKGGFVAPKYHS